ncbi:MAG: pyridoxal-dependent decarboxylase [Gemmatimonadota bacterium]|nr:pyridoxal-dependent decarboxylase [Gemmatimonadota bacterium]
MTALHSGMETRGRNILDELHDDETAESGAEFLGVAARYFASTRLGEGSVSTALTPAEIAARFSEAMPLTGRPLSEIVERIEREVFADANKLCHPMAMGHQVSAPLPAAVWTESVIGALNQSLAIFEMSPTGTMLEHQVIRWMCDLVGYPAGSSGTLTSGGTEASFTALLAARNAAMPDAWENGVGADAPYVVHGEHSHYAVTRAIGQLGLGRKRGIAIRSRDYRMDVAHLSETLDALDSEKKRILAVVATAGSTATGSFDDLEAIRSICDERGIWLHVDAAHGASALLSSRPPRALLGLKRARSLAWDPHKGMLLPLSAGMLLVRDERDLEGAFTQQAPYLFKGSDAERNPDQGRKSFQCSRRADVLKLWVALQRYGAKGIGELYDGLCATTRELYEMIVEHPLFEALHEPESNILCFRYAGSDDLNRELRPSFNRNGSGWITSTVLDGRPVLRVTIMNPRTSSSHLSALLDGLSAEAKRLGV